MSSTTRENVQDSSLLHNYGIPSAYMSSQRSLVYAGFLLLDLYAVKLWFFVMPICLLRRARRRLDMFNSPHQFDIRLNVDRVTVRASLLIRLDVHRGRGHHDMLCHYLS